MKQNKSNTKSNSTRYPNNILPHRTPEAVGWITAEIMISYRTSLPVRFLFVPESRNSQIRKWWAACSDFGKKLEVLGFLAFWKPEQQAAHHFRIWRPHQRVST